MPYVLYQVWAFVAPGLYKHERRFAFPLIVSSIVLFYAGVAFAYYIVFPLMFGFLTSTTPVGVKMMTDISQYLDFILLLFLAFGMAFEVPVAVVLLVATGLVKVEALKRNRGYMVLAIFIVAALFDASRRGFADLHGGADVPLYELGIVFAQFAQKSRAAAAHASDA